MIRLLIADDHEAVRRGVRQIVDAESDMRVIAEASNASELLALARAHPADAIVLDITMPGRSGLDALRELRRDLPGVPVLVLSMHPAEQYGPCALRAGARGYLTKANAPAQLVTAIRRALDLVAAGEHVTPELNPP